MSEKTDASKNVVEQFEIVNCVPVEEGFVKLTLRGHLDADGAPMLCDRLHDLRTAGSVKVELDFAGVQFISSTGIGTIIAAVGEFRDAGGALVICGLSDDLRELFEMLDLMDYVTIRS